MRGIPRRVYLPRVRDRKAETREREKEKEALINEIRNGSKYYIKREKLSCVLYEPTPITVEDEYME